MQDEKANSLREGYSLGHYRTLSQIGAGSMGEVNLAEDTRLDVKPPRQITDFTSDRIFWFDFAPDGKQLALSRGTITGDVVLISNFK